MPKGNRKNHGIAFKAKVALETIQEQQTLSELADRFQMHRNQIAQWKKQLLDRAEEISGMAKAPEKDSSAQEPHTRIGRLTTSTTFFRLNGKDSNMKKFV